MRTHPLRVIALLPLALTLAGCGPMMVPAVERLDPDEQAVVDGMWDNLLSPTGKVDRDTLLDTILIFQLHQRGVNRVMLHSEKDFAGGMVAMDVTFDLNVPSDDRFDVEVRDRKNQTVRRESYTGEEVFDRFKSLWQGAPHEPELAPDGSPNEPDEVRAEREVYRARVQRIAAATQPAAVPQ